MKSVILPGNTGLCVAKLWKPVTLPIWSTLCQLSATSVLESVNKPKSSTSFSSSAYPGHRSHTHYVALGLSFTSSPTKGWIVLSECSATSWRCSTSRLMLQRSLVTRSSFWKTGHHGIMNSSTAFLRWVGILCSDATCFFRYGWLFLQRHPGCTHFAERKMHVDVLGEHFWIVLAL